MKKTKQKNKYIRIAIAMPLMMIILAGCDGFLDEKPSKSQVIPKTLNELEGLLDDNPIGMNKDLNLSNLATDDFELTPGALMQLTQLERNSYLWEYDPFLEDVSGEWAGFYKQIYNSNLVLEGLDELESQYADKAIHELRGRALFTKAQAYFFLMQAYALPYDRMNAQGLPGIPLRNTTDINQESTRASMEESYQEIEALLELSLEFLPNLDPERKRPSRWAAQALLSRLHLAKGDFQNSLEHTESALSIGSDLMDYNGIDSTASNPFQPFGTENIYNVVMVTRSFWSSSGTGVEPELYQSYDSLDLRKYLFFENSPEGVNIFNGSYTGNHEFFAGYATDELYLTKAECLVRLGRSEEGREAIKVLMGKRYKAGTDLDSFIPDGGKGLLDFILEERRKELVFRNIRWMDLRRLNSEQEYQITLERNVYEQSYSLSPGSVHYAFPIPLDEIRLNGLIQNSGYD